MFKKIMLRSSIAKSSEHIKVAEDTTICSSMWELAKFPFIQSEQTFTRQQKVPIVGMFAFLGTKTSF